MLLLQWPLHIVIGTENLCTSCAVVYWPPGIQGQILLSRCICEPMDHLNKICIKFLLALYGSLLALWPVLADKSRAESLSQYTPDHAYACRHFHVFERV